ncbi:MAG: Zn-dependent protease [Desulfosarcina sp.]|nr:Zn-dependent protease [Desulfosarcina sp.]MBC2741729.1 Zn-dependent protease [Desulfosarcina sp.]MBC2764643.1 Zn-dependent protease [Desulfosarcina sp.]
MTAISRETILIAPIGDFDADILYAVEKMVPRIFGMPCRIEPLLDDIGFAWNAERRQFHSTAILAELSGKAPIDAFKVIALTRKDLFIPILTHVYGEAQLGGTSCIVSTCRLTSGISTVGQRSLYLERITKETAHELGHTFDLRHCKDHQCLMHYCRSIGDVDAKSSQLCRYCEVLLNDQLKREGRR